MREQAGPEQRKRAPETWAVRATDAQGGSPFCAQDGRRQPGRRSLRLNSQAVWNLPPQRSSQPPLVDTPPLPLSTPRLRVREELMSCPRLRGTLEEPGKAGFGALPVRRSTPGCPSQVAHAHGTQRAWG